MSAAVPRFVVVLEEERGTFHAAVLRTPDRTHAMAIARGLRAQGKTAMVYREGGDDLVAVTDDE